MHTHTHKKAANKQHTKIFTTDKLSKHIWKVNVHKMPTTTVHHQLFFIYVSLLASFATKSASPIGLDDRNKPVFATTTVTPIATTLRQHRTSSAPQTLRKVQSKLYGQHRPTDSPLLNYIFDSHLAINKHHHFKSGPHFEEVSAANVTVQSSQTAQLDCRITALSDKTVSWVRRVENAELQLLTVGVHTYSGDARYSVEFLFPHNWRLRIANTTKTDEGLYECQISTHPPKVSRVYFTVQAPEVQIIDEHGIPLHDKYYEVDSTIQLECVVKHVAMHEHGTVYWHHNLRLLNYDTERGGIAVRTDLTDNGANSTLSIARIAKHDSGTYACSIDDTANRKTVDDQAAVIVHVLNGESLAELYHGNGMAATTNDGGHIMIAVYNLCSAVLIYFYGVR